MTWVAVGMVGAAAIGYAGQERSNSAAAKAAKKQGYVDTVTTRTPAPGTEGYRAAGLDAAHQALFGFTPQGHAPAPVLGDPNKPGGAGSGPAVPPGGSRRPDGRILDKNGKTIYAPPKKAASAPAASGKGGGSGAGVGATPSPAPAPRAFDGMSEETDTIRRDLMKLPGKNAAMYDAAEGYLTDTLGGIGGEGSRDRNAYRGEAAGAARAISEDPGLQEYINVLSGAAGGSSGARRGTGGGGGFGGALTRSAYTSGPSAPAAITSATGADAALRKLIAGEDAPGIAAAEDAITRKVMESRAAALRELKANAVGSSFYGGDYYEDLHEGAIARGDMGLADSLAAARFGAYQNALGLGTEYDLGMADIAARERASGASAAAAGADLASRERLAQLEMWGDALGLGQQGRIASAGALGDLAGLTSEDLNSAVAGVNALGASRRGDLGAAGDLSLGSDSARNQYLAARGSERVGMAGVNLGRRELAFDRERFYDPFARISAYGDALNAFYGDYGTEETHGRDTRSTAPAAYSSPWGAALQGAALGGQVAGSYQQRNKAQAAPAGSSYGSAAFRD